MSNLVHQKKRATWRCGQCATRMSSTETECAECGAVRGAIQQVAMPQARPASYPDFSGPVFNSHGRQVQNNITILNEGPTSEPECYDYVPQQSFIPYEPVAMHERKPGFFEKFVKFMTTVIMLGTALLVLSFGGFLAVGLIQLLSRH